MSVVPYPDAKPEVLVLVITGLDDQQEVMTADETKPPWWSIAALVRLAWAAGMGFERIEEILRAAAAGSFDDATVEADESGFIIGIYRRG